MAVPRGGSDFIESMGLFFESNALPRISGRIWALVLLADKPLSMEELATSLKVSRASVSTNLRDLVTLGLLDTTAVPGDRVRYYRFADNGFIKRFESGIKSAEEQKRLAQNALRSLDKSAKAGAERLRTMIRFSDFWLEELTKTMNRWRALERRSERQEQEQ